MFILASHLQKYYWNFEKFDIGSYVFMNIMFKANSHITEKKKARNELEI
jgi:hypothetical protein